jgi:hypothetical protein
MTRKLIITFVLAMSMISIQSQTITILEQDLDFVVEEKQEEFYYIEKDFPLSDDRWLATLEGYCTNTKKSNLENLFYGFWKKANNLGANAFFIDDFSNTPDTISVTISVFNLTEKELDDNYALYSCNKIYVFGDLIAPNIIKNKIPKNREIKINKEKIKIFPLSYYEYQSDIGEKVSVSNGGLLGTSYTRTGEDGKVSVYLSLSGGTLKPVITPMGGVGIGFSNGGIYPLDMNFGQFLAEILRKRKLAKEMEQ